MRRGAVAIRSAGFPARPSLRHVRVPSRALCPRQLAGLLKFPLRSCDLPVGWLPCVPPQGLVLDRSAPSPHASPHLCVQCAPPRRPSRRAVVVPYRAKPSRRTSATTRSHDHRRADGSPAPPRASHDPEIYRVTSRLGSPLKSPYRASRDDQVPPSRLA